MTSSGEEQGTPQAEAMVDTILNLSHYHREHELFYSRAPLEIAVRLQVASDVLKALALKWEANEPTRSTAGPDEAPPRQSRYAGCTDLNVSSATDALGILFMEGEPAELTKLKRDLLALADEHEQGGGWLDEAMQGSWTAGEALIAVCPLANVLGDRHRIIVNIWQMSSDSLPIAKLLQRAVVLLEAVELTPEAIRADVANARVTPADVLGRRDHRRSRGYVRSRRSPRARQRTPLAAVPRPRRDASNPTPRRRSVTGFGLLTHRTNDDELDFVLDDREGV